ncbi:MAG: hypothetical protein KatS3mg009_0380 [Acidimicrobiia bacterium]|nr:MAG: hypothetical protein KatS3mg009_0380 [Acidimicrobiia bacterium]
MPGTGDARTPIPADADVFTPDAVEAIRAHMNADHAHDNLVICRAHGAPGARRAELRTVDASGLTFAATTGDGTVVVHVPWPSPVTSRRQVRTEVVRVYEDARVRLGLDAPAGPDAPLG